MQFQNLIIYETHSIMDIMLYLEREHCFGMQLSTDVAVPVPIFSTCTKTDNFNEVCDF